MADLSVIDLTRRFGAFEALKGISFHVPDGAFVTLLGPSGCGKSTTLSALAGLDRPTGGTIRIGARKVFEGASGLFVEPQQRNLGMMFQSYALWPHLTVVQNLQFPLDLRKIRGAEARRRIDETLALVDMTAFADRYPGELSGGQQQRVALARTLVYRPEILLLDEPLSNLDAKLRDKARIWIGELQRQTGVTTVYVTHDQSEALSMSDRIIVMNNGTIAQNGTPEDIYRHPANEFVADFVGASNILSADLRRREGRAELLLDGGLAIPLTGAEGAHAEGPVRASIRPEQISVVPEGQGLPVRVLANSYVGARNILLVALGQQSLRLETARRVSSEQIHIAIAPEDITLFEPGGGSEAA